MSNRAAEVASRTGAVQTAAQSVAPKQNNKTNRDAEAARVATYGEEEFQGGLTNVATFAPTEKTRSRRAAKRRQTENVEARRTDEGREVEGRNKKVSGEAKVEKKSKALLRRASNWTPDRGYKTAQALLNQQSLLQQASIKFEQNRPESQGMSTPFGQQQAMLDSLINMTEMLYHQHTGDKAGEIYNRPATRQILTALKGLKDGAMTSEEPVQEVRAPKRKKREFMAQMARIEKVQRQLEPQVFPDDYEPLELVA
ncbi:hypothetical protein JST97_08415 [bacterium]|nr:hypothetical protein [bacterium]